MPIIPPIAARPPRAVSAWTSEDDAELDLLALAIAVDVLRQATR